MMFAGCACTPKEDRSHVSENQVTEKDTLIQAISGWKDSYQVEQGINSKVLTHDLEYDPDTVKSIEVDERKVDWNKPGSYVAIYKITYLVSKAGEDEKTDVVEIEVPINVLCEEEAKSEKAKGKDVIGREEFEEELKKDESSSKTSKEETKEEPKNEESRKSEKETPTTEDRTRDENKPSTPSTGGNTSNPTTPTQQEKNPDPEPSKPAQPQHSHTWVEQFSTVNHPEQGHYEQVVVNPAWTENIPIYGYDERVYCSQCGMDITDLGQSGIDHHIEVHALRGENAGYYCGVISVITGYETITHSAEYESRYVVDQAPWTEQVSNGYLCSGCGARK